jgi:hypothetical protein
LPEGRLEEGIKAREKTSRRGKNRALIQELIPIAQDLARRLKDEGVTACELRAVAQHKGIIKKGTQLDFLGSVFRQAGLVNSGRRRRSVIRVSHGNLHTVWLSPE